MDPLSVSNITADAIAIQERDGFRAAGWQKVLAPAKVNLYLAIGAKRPDGYHSAETVLHAINIHDTLYIRRKPPTASDFGTGRPVVVMVTCGDVALPPLDSADNLAAKAVMALAEAVGDGDCATDVEIRIEKNIPFQAGLGGASGDAAAALVGAARLWGLDPADERIEATARTLGADVPFFLHGGCAYLDGVGDRFVHALQPMKHPLVLVKPAGGVSTAQAYGAFDGDPRPVPEETAARAREAREAQDVPLFNNLAAAAHSLLPELQAVGQWIEQQPGVQRSLLCGSGACTFAPCESFEAACAAVAQARKRGWWARATSFGAMGAIAVGTGVQG